MKYNKCRLNGLKQVGNLSDRIGLWYRVLTAVEVEFPVSQ
jgi:hypothetical protein